MYTSGRLMSNFAAFFSAFSLPKNFTGDVSFLLFFVGASLAIGFIFGRWKLINILINAYIALAFIGVLPKSLYETSVYGKAGIFVLILVILTAIDKRLFDLHISNAGVDFFWRLLVMSLLMTGMIVSVVLSFLPKIIVLGFISSAAYGYFVSPWALIFWMIMPLISLLFINNRLK